MDLLVVVRRWKLSSMKLALAPLSMRILAGHPAIQPRTTIKSGTMPGAASEAARDSSGEPGAGDGAVRVMAEDML